MKWNWEKQEWPNFSYKTEALAKFEKEFIHQTGIFVGTVKHINNLNDLKIELVSEEAIQTSKIEGELLNRESVQSSIRKNFGLKAEKKKITDTESGISELMVDLYSNFDLKISHKTLYEWNSLILYGKKDLNTKYRTDEEPMQIISGPVHRPKVHFEAPPCARVKEEMDQFIKWFNSSKAQALTKAGIAHLYFVSIHPFDDGNGRIARALTEKALAQSLNQGSLISLSYVIEKYRKQYYKALDNANKDLEITDYLIYFAQTILAGLEHSQKLIEFTIAKSKFYEKHKAQLNSRQAKVISRVLKEGIEGFGGGLSAENYISITKTSRATATRDLQDLVEKKILKRTGERKSTRYKLNL